MKNYTYEIQSTLNSFVGELQRLKNVVEKFNNYVATFNTSSAFIVALTDEQQQQIKATIYNLSLKISSLDFECIATDTAQLIAASLALCTEQHSKEIEENLVCLEKFMEIYSKSFSTTICDYLKYINNLTTIKTHELIKRGLSVIVVIDNVAKKTSELLTLL